MFSAAPAPCFIEHEPSLQQPSLQHDAASFDAESFFIGHESPEQQQHDIAVSAETELRVYAIAAPASPRTSNTEIASNNLFIIFTSYFMKAN